MIESESRLIDSMLTPALSPEAPLLRVDGLTTYIQTPRGLLHAVDDVSFDLAPGRTLGVVGESGSGKSVMARSLLGLLPEPPAIKVGGRVMFGGRDLRQLSESALRRVRGREIAMVFQDPMTALNPVLPIGRQIAQVVQLHLGMTRRQAIARALVLLDSVGIPSPKQRLEEYPHLLSGGMRQRVMIALALACDPKLLIADEPTTALDVTVQAQILELLASLRAELGMAMLLITHDLAVVAEACDEVMVLYAGRVVERAPTAELLARPRHPYTAGLLRARESLEEIPGSLPAERLPGCAFAPRCTRAQDRCRAEAPELAAIGASLVRCHFPREPR